MTMHPDDAQTVHLWKQDEIILWILNEHRDIRFNVDMLIDHMESLGYPARKRKRDTLNAVLSRLLKKDKIKREKPGEYYV